MTKEVGTLRQLNVQVGDVVTHSRGATYEIRQRSNGPELWRLKWADGTSQGGWGVSVADSTEEYTLVSRATKPGPVITETITTTVQRIVPGKYGDVKLHDPGSKYIRVNIDAAMGVEQLTAAIETLTQIRDAMTGEPQ